MAKNQTSKNSNIFYQMYSTSQKVQDSGFKCNSALDEGDTSFDIDGSEGVITDSNGDELSSIDFGSIHADELTEYNNETKIIGPQDVYLIQGNVKGDSYALQAFRITDIIQEKEYYDSFINIKFSINWISCGNLESAEIDTYYVRTEPGSVCDLIQSELDKLCCPVAVTIQNLEECEKCNYKNCKDMSDFLVFQSNEEGIQFYVYDVFVSTIDPDYENYDGSFSDYSETPFVNGNIDFDYILDIIRRFAPRQFSDDCQCCCENNDYSEVPCDIYKFLVTIGPLAMNDKDAFSYNIKGLTEFAKYIDDCGNIIDEAGFRRAVAKYPDLYSYYFGLRNAILLRYNIHDILKILVEISNYIHQANVQGPYRLQEEFCKRVNAQKYKSGAMRGIILIIDWAGMEEDLEALKVAHVPDKITLLEPVELPKGFSLEGYKCAPTLYNKVEANVEPSAVIKAESDFYNKNCNGMPIRRVFSNSSLKQETDSIWTRNLHKRLSNNTQWCNNYDYHTNDIWCNESEYHDAFNTENNGLKYESSVNEEFIIKEDYINERVRPAVYPVHPKYRYLENLPGITKSEEDMYGIIHEEKSVGLYRLMSFLNENNMFTTVGQIYFVIASKDDYTSSDKNLLNSLLVYNPNKVPIRCKIMVFS